MAVDLEGAMGALSRIIDRVLADGREMSGSTVADVIEEATAVEAPLGGSRIGRQVSDSLIGLGPLEELLEDPAVSDILVNAPDEIWIERAGRLERADVAFPSPEAVVAAVERALLPLGLRIDRASPAVDARLPDGSRLHAVVPPAAVDGPVVAIRRFTAAVLDFSDLIASGSIDQRGVEIIDELVLGRVNVIVSGATGAGKTTLLNVLSRSIPSSERVVTVEEAAELRLDGHVVRLEARAANAEGAGQVTVRSLVRHALRMRPDRIVVGEVRGAEALDLIQAMSTGHEGSMGTVHASGAQGAMWRIETLAATAGEIPHEALRSMLWAAVGAIVHVERSGALRRIRDVSVIAEGAISKVWSWSQ
jgi:pilus assembly protein CpaF